MRIQKHPNLITTASDWPTLADVPDGIETEEMSPDKYAAWKAKQPAIVQPLPVPVSLPAWRILSVMDLHGYTPTVEAIIDSLPKNSKVVAKRQLAGSNIERTHALVLAAQQALGLTDAQVDDLFREADALI